MKIDNFLENKKCSFKTGTTGKNQKKGQKGNKEQLGTFLVLFGTILRKLIAKIPGQPRFSVKRVLGQIMSLLLVNRNPEVWLDSVNIVRLGQVRLVLLVDRKPWSLVRLGKYCQLIEK